MAYYLHKVYFRYFRVRIQLFVMAKSDQDLDPHGSTVARLPRSGYVLIPYQCGCETQGGRLRQPMGPRWLKISSSLVFKNGFNKE
jgi:hypothetical protein